MNTTLLEGLAFLAPAVALLTAAGCATVDRLGQYTFAGREVAVVVGEAPRAEIPRPERVLPFYPGGQPEPPEEPGVDTAAIRDKLDAAFAGAGLARRLGEGVLRQGAAVLGATPAEAPGRSDYTFELEIRRFAVEADPSYSRAGFTLEVGVRLEDTGTGAAIWSTRVYEREPLPPSAFGLPDRPGRVVSLDTLAELSVDRIERGLRKLVDDAAAAAVEKLREAYPGPD